MTIKQLIEELTDQRITENSTNWRMIQHSFYVRVLRKESLGQRIERDANEEVRLFREKPRPAVIIVANTPF